MMTVESSCLARLSRTGGQADGEHDLDRKTGRQERVEAMAGVRFCRAFDAVIRQLP